MAKQLPWRDAIVKVLTGAEAMHYTDIADEIVKQELRTKLGATPANTVYTTIYENIKNSESPLFRKVGRGEFTLYDSAIAASTEDPLSLTDETTAVIRSLGMYWQRSLIDWSPVHPRLLGRQQAATESVDFSDEVGVYLLYDRRDVVYAGQVLKQPLGKRLRDHTIDRFSGRWDRFSWFGLRGVDESGKLCGLGGSYPTLTVAKVVDAFEALLIEAIEPPLNRKRGYDLQGSEYLQVTDPEIEKRRGQQFLANMITKL